jgi:hypothetical protein
MVMPKPGPDGTTRWKSWFRRAGNPVRGLVYPKSHDVSALVKIPRDDGQDLSKFPDLEDYTVFAVQYRYEAYDNEDDIDRDEAIEKTRTFLAHVQGVLNSTP